MNQVDLLIRVLLDKNASIAERDDAAIDLRYFDDAQALNALLSIVLNPTEEPFIMDVCGESIAEIWLRHNYFDPDLYKKMTSVAQHEIYGYIEANKPEWIEKYQL